MKYDECTTEFVKREELLLSKFVLVLNEKKNKIRELSGHHDDAMDSATDEEV